MQSGCDDAALQFVTPGWQTETTIHNIVAVIMILIEVIIILPTKDASYAANHVKG